jgi:hypothetical protein
MPLHSFRPCDGKSHVRSEEIKISNIELKDGWA